MKKLIICLIFLIFYYFYIPNNLYAAFSLKVASLSANVISSTEEAILVNLQITDLPSDSYFRVAFQKQEGAFYFGYIKNHLNQWIKVSDNCNNFYFTNKSTTELTIPLKIGDYTIESGTYNIKAHRYTISCNSTVSINSLPIEIILPSPTPTLTSTLTPSQNYSPTPLPTPTSTLIPTITPSPTLEPISFNNIFISEVMVNPNSGDKEWIELYNDNDFDVNIDNWYIDDIENGGASPRKFSCFIKAKSYCIIELTSAIFNNSKDSVRLLDFNKNLKDDFEYQNSLQGKSYGRINFENNDFCLEEPSPNNSNNSCIINLTPTLTPLLTSIIKTTTSNIINNLKETKILKPTTQLIKLNYLNNTNHYNSNVDNYQSNNVLGITTQKVFKKHNQNLYYLFFLSIIYSTLTIISILIKIKIISYEKIKRIFLSSSYPQ